MFYYVEYFQKTFVPFLNKPHYVRSSFVLFGYLGFNAMYFWQYFSHIAGPVLLVEEAWREPPTFSVCDVIRSYQVMHISVAK